MRLSQIILLLLFMAAPALKGEDNQTSNLLATIDGKVDEIDTSSVTVEEVVESMLSVIDGEREPTVGKVDWLGQLEESRRLGEYFR